MTTPEPIWTRGRLARLLRQFYSGPRGGLDVAAAAADLQVSKYRVRQWLRGPEQEPAPIAADVLEKLTVGDERTRRRAEGKAAYARNALTAISLPHGIDVKPEWDKQGWLGDHIVLLVQLHGRPWRQLMMTKSARAADMARKHGDILDEVTLPGGKFAGDVLIAEAMHRQAAWAVRPPASVVPAGFGQIWSDDAPELDLGVLAVELGLR